jgi:hypothetical protein
MRQSTLLKTTHRQKRIICVPCDFKKHQAIIKNPAFDLQFLGTLQK